MQIKVMNSLIYIIGNYSSEGSTVSTGVVSFLSCPNGYKVLSYKLQLVLYSSISLLFVFQKLQPAMREHEEELV